ncbi:MAG: SWF/SNF helicase family protein [Odoribacter sp.]|nr:SWF/SNF helicase family protein [Odoribacter sp.]
MLEEVIGSGHKVLIFSAFVKCLNLVAEEIEKRDWQYAILTGSTTDREKVIEHFQQNKNCSLFLISLKAGGVGLNLTEADYVFILDPWWNLAAEYQAISRAHRIGQKNAVFVYRFITVGTLEEKILKIQQRKLKLTESVMNPAALTDKLDEAEMWEVLEE